MKKPASIAIVILGLMLLTAYQAAFTVDQTEKALVLQFGKPISADLEPGLHFKVPFIQDVIHLDARLLDYDAKPEEILTKDKKNMVVDSYAKWRITDTLQFYKNFKTIRGAMARLDDIIRGGLREVMGRYQLHEVVSDTRQQLMDEVTLKAREAMTEFGIEVMDVRIKRTDLPEANERAVFERMRAERVRKAKQYRAEGQEESAKIRAEAERKRTIIIAEAQKKAEILRGEGDAEATGIYAKAYTESPEFYAFKRSLEAYEKSLKDNTSIIMTPESPFLKHFK
ncbi:MAG: protease modulator HflC [Proteobacteria bacterium]|nr:protease modulator HflC [Pseudomonadota bacterium]MBU1610605.1 protease modulator HflC [Pseudomonadota bacterium]